MEPAIIRYTLCFLTRGEQVLMLHRRRPPNQNLWNGVGGHIEPGEHPSACMLREIREETGYELARVRFAGLLTWDGFEIPAGGLYLFTAQAPQGEPCANDEGDLAWKHRDWVFHAPEVVSNIHVFAPLVLDGAPVQGYHFSYQAGVIQSFYIYSLPDGAARMENL